MKVCLVTLCIGEKYINQYNNLFRHFHEDYAKKCNYDFKIITDYIQEPKHPSVISLNKILVCEYNWKIHYDIIIFIDADIIINKTTPPLHNYYNFGDKIGCVNSNPDLEARVQGNINSKNKITAKEYYKIKSNHTIDTEHIINTGVLVIQPNKHKQFLQNIFKQYSQSQINNKEGFHYEQSVIGYELQKNNISFLMDSKWNAIWKNNKYYNNFIKKKNITLQEFFNDNFFIHLAGKCDFNLIDKLKY